MTLSKALDEYKTIYMPYRNFAKRTRDEYQNDLEDFIEFAEGSNINHVNKIGIPIVEHFIAGLEHKGYSSLTRKRKVVTLRSFFSFLYRDGHLRTNIAAKIILPFTETTIPHFLTQTESDRLRAACANIPRDRAIIELLIQTGIKLSELTRLTLNDIDLDGSDGAGERQVGFIRILGNRGKKDRMLPLNDKSNLALKNYLKLRENTGNDILFLNRFGKPVSDRGVQKMLKKYFQKADIGRASVHTLRHTFGLHHASGGMNIKTLQEVMGQKDIRSTMIYVSLTGQMRDKIRNNLV